MVVRQLAYVAFYSCIVKVLIKLSVIYFCLLDWTFLQCISHWFVAFQRFQTVFQPEEENHSSRGWWTEQMYFKLYDIRTCMSTEKLDIHVLNVKQPSSNSLHCQTPHFLSQDKNLHQLRRTIVYDLLSERRHQPCTAIRLQKKKKKKKNCWEYQMDT